MFGSGKRSSLKSHLRNVRAYAAPVADATVSTLSAMTISSGTLTPTFNSGTVSYTDAITFGTGTVTVTPTVTEAHATILVRANGSGWANVTSGQASAALPMNLGANTIDVKVTAQNTSATTYTTTATRAAYSSTKCLSFAAASSQYANTADTSDHDFTTAMSLSCWLKGATPAGGTGIVTKADILSDISYYIGNAGTAPGKLYAIVSSTGGFDKIYRSTAVVFDSTWHHVAITFGASTLKIYIDGALDTTPTKEADGAVTTLKNSASGLSMGTLFNGGTPGNFYNGKVDELSLWSIALSATDITALYNSGKPADLSAHAQFANCKSWYKCGDGDTIGAAGIIDSVSAHNMSPTNTPTIATDAP